GLGDVYKRQVQYRTAGENGPWATALSEVRLDEAGTWYYINCVPEDSLIANNPSVAFRVVGYDAGASELMFDEVEVFALLPESGSVAMVVLAITMWWRWK
ncbi:MAG: hypothetical protein N2595_00630, partial [bacterium]|nr:hypothetical protein [bacterium]